VELGSKQQMPLRFASGWLPSDWEIEASIFKRPAALSLRKAWFGARSWLLKLRARDLPRLLGFARDCRASNVDQERHQLFSPAESSQKLYDNPREGCIMAGLITLGESSSQAI